MISYLDECEIDGYVISNSPFSRCLGYYDNGVVVGVLDFSIIYEKVEINNIYVNGKYRNLGIASKLLEFMIREIGEFDNITLEVRVDNAAALGLYKKFGFKVVGVRKSYYDGIDGYLMLLGK